MARALLLVAPKQLDPLSLPLLSALFLLATITLVCALCASHHRKPRPPSPPPKSISSSEVHEEKLTVLPATHGPIGPTEPPSSAKPMTPRRKLSISLSLKLPEGLTRVRTGRREESEKERNVSEDSTWMKAIILGEKCKVPDNSEQEEEEEIVVYDEKGNRRRNYHPRTPRSMPVSRNNSFVFPSSSS